MLHSFSCKAATCLNCEGRANLRSLGCGGGIITSRREAASLVELWFICWLCIQVLMSRSFGKRLATSWIVSPAADLRGLGCGGWDFQQEGLGFRFVAPGSLGEFCCQQQHWLCRDYYRWCSLVGCGWRSRGRWKWRRPRWRTRRRRRLGRRWGRNGGRCRAWQEYGRTSRPPCGRRGSSTSRTWSRQGFQARWTWSCSTRLRSRSGSRLDSRVCGSWTRLAAGCRRFAPPWACTLTTRRRKYG